ncbi:MAG: MIP family channel protein [Desulfarculales bacterium]|jgi:MIP family channel proteins|nr:MIP family channel protein [Desulfarculales bacterium]
MVKREFTGEFIGTFILVLFGCGSVAVSVLFDALTGLMQIASVWGMGVTLAIYATRHLSCAHLNPAVSLAMVLSRRMPAGKLPCYWSAQLAGAIAAAGALYLCFGSSIEAYESLNGIVRGTAESAQVAKMFGEYYSLPGSGSAVSLPLAAGVEALGTFLLVFMIFSLTEGCNVGRPSHAAAPLFIGITVSALICLLAPLTQAGLNPARDFGPRLVAWLMGWGSAAWPDEKLGFFIVYILGPMIGGGLAAFVFAKIIEPLLAGQIAGGCENKPGGTGDNNMQTDLILVGGFLGAGKTTFLNRISKYLAAGGKKTGLITNDQASALVDTAFLSSDNGRVAEVSGSCFCCNYNGFMEAAHSLRRAGADTIIAEPVGSCTDLSATIIQPLKDKGADIFKIYPLSVFVDPFRLSEILLGNLSGLHPSAVYIVLKQLEEADLVVINKSDLLSPETMKRLREQTESRFPGKPVLALSAKTGAGFAQWLDTVSSLLTSGKTIAEVDYDIYAEGEAVLGWLNLAVSLEGQASGWDEFAAGLLNSLAGQLDAAGLAVAHVKIMLESGGAYVMGNITGDKSTVQLRNSAGNDGRAKLTVNARVETAPETLLELVRKVLHEQCLTANADYCIETSNCLKPGRPNPTHRYAQAVV